MSDQDNDIFTKRAALLKALAHPERMRITHILSEKSPLCVCEIQEKMGINISTLSRHLERLKKAGIVSDKRDGRNIYYTLRFTCLERFLTCIDSLEKEECCLV